METNLSLNADRRSHLDRAGRLARLALAGGLAFLVAACGGGGGGGGGGGTPNTPPTAAIAATPTSGKAPLTVALDGSGSRDTDGTIATYAWSFSDGSAGASGVATSKTFANPGSYTVTLTVTDNAGATGTATRSITVNANTGPTAAFSATPTSGKSPLTVNFDATASTDGDGSIASYAWAFGDGKTGTGATTSNVYATPGTFTATLTVTDSDGATATRNATITVIAPVGTVEVTVKDTNGTAVSGALAVASVGGLDRSGTTNASGVVSLLDVRAGTGTVAVSRESFISKSVPVTVTDGALTRLPVELVRVTRATGGVVTTSVPTGGVSADGRTLEFSIQVVVVNEGGGEVTGLTQPAFTLRNCTPNAATPDPDCLSGGTADVAYTVLGPGAAPSFEALPGGTPQPYAAALAFDQSASIERNDPTDARIFSAKEFLKSLGGSDVAAVAAFADGESAGAEIPVRPVTIYPVGAPSFTSNGRDLFDELDSLSTLEGGGTPLYEALCRLMDFSVASAPAGVRRAVVVFTDGRDDPAGTTGAYTCRSLAAAVAKSVATDVDIFSIGLSGEVDGNALATLAAAGNGVFLFAEDVTQLIPIYGSLGNLLSGSLSTYRLSFRITADAAGTFAPGRNVRGVLTVSASSNTVNLPFVVRIF
jgi:PKD repeat protein